MPVGLLGPLGYMHLESAERLGMASLAIGTRAYDALEAFDKVSQIGDPVLLYSSHREPPLLEASWEGTWGGWRFAGREWHPTP